MTDQWSVIGELLTTTGPLGTLLLAVALMIRTELRKRFDQLDGAIRDNTERFEKLADRVNDLERRHPTLPPVALHSTPAEA